MLVEGVDSCSCTHDWMHLLVSANRKEEGEEEGYTILFLFSVLWKFKLLTTAILNKRVPVCVQGSTGT